MVDLAALQKRFFSHVDRSRGDVACWKWTGSSATGGYPVFWMRIGGKQRTFRAHRLSYQLAYGGIPDALTLDHTCSVRMCVNPAHLEPVTLAENVRRAQTDERRGQRRAMASAGTSTNPVMVRDVDIVARLGQVAALRKQRHFHARSWPSDVAREALYFALRDPRILRLLGIDAKLRKQLRDVFADATAAPCAGTLAPGSRESPDAPGDASALG